MTPLLPLAVSWLCAGLLVLLDGRKRGVQAFAVAALAAVLALDLALLLVPGHGAAFETVTGGWPQGVGIRLRVDRLALFFGALAAAVLCLVMLHESRAGIRSRLLPALVLFLSSGLHGAFFTGDLFNFYVFFEVSMVTSFALAAYGYGRAEVRGAFVYVALNLFGSVLFLLGVAALYHGHGTLDLEHLALRVGADASGTTLLAGALVLAALAVKLGLFPFHGWVPVLYGHAAPAIAAAMSCAGGTIAAYGLLRYGFAVSPGARDVAGPLLVVSGAAAALYGACLALHRARPAEIAAYVAIVHAGFVVLAVGIGGPHGVAAALLTVLSGALDKALLFLSLDAGAWRAPAALVGAASASGLPLTVGFVSKVELFRAALESPAAPLVLAALALSTVALLAAVFRFRHFVSQGDGPRRGAAAAAALLAAAVVLLGLVASPVADLARDVALDLLGGAA